MYNVYAISTCAWGLKKLKNELIHFQIISRRLCILNTSAKLVRSIF